MRRAIGNSPLFLAIPLSLVVILFLLFANKSAKPLDICYELEYESTSPSESQDDRTSIGTYSDLEPITQDDIGRLSLLNVWRRSSETLFYSAFSRDGSFLALGNANFIQILDIYNEHEVSKIVTDPSVIFGITYLTSGDLFILSTNLNSRSSPMLFDLWEFGDGRRSSDAIQLSIQRNYNEHLDHIAFSPNDRCFAADEGTSIALWDRYNWTKLANIAAGNVVTSFMFSPDGRYVAYGTDGDNDSVGTVFLGIEDFQTGERTEIPEAHRGRISTVSFSPNTNYIATGSIDNTIRLWDTAGTNIHDFAAGDVVIDTAFSNDEDLLVAITQARQLEILNIPDMEMLVNLDTEGDMMSVFFIPSSQLIVGVGENGDIYYWGISN